MSIVVSPNCFVSFWLDLRFIGDKGFVNVPPVLFIEGASIGKLVGVFVGRFVGALVGALVGGGATYRYISNCAFIRST